MDIPKISVLIICYEQENLIKRAIDSLLSQKDYIYEICVSDDCSSDRTWEVLQEYDKQYPGLFKLHQNNPNVGIFENIEYSWTMPTGDIVYRLAGDDECGDGWFKSVVEFIQQNKIDYQNELFCIYGDFQAIYPNGDSFLGKNSPVVDTNRMPLSLYERGLINNRGCTYSVNILKLFRKVSVGRSYIAENAQDSQLHIFAQKRYYISKVANKYYSGVGVSKSMGALRKEEHKQTMQYAFNFFAEIGVQLPQSDKYLPKFNVAQKEFRWNPSIKRLITYAKYSFLCCDISLIMYSINYRRLIFRVLHRLPHRKTVQL